MWFVIWWPQHGCKVLVDAPLAQFPAWLLLEAKGGMGTTGPDLGSFTRPATDVPIPRPVGPVTKFQKNYAWKSVAMLGMSCAGVGRDRAMPR